MTDGNLDPSAIVDLVGWADLENADGSAFPDTPAKLRDLMSGEIVAVTSSLDHLYSALLNDEVVYSATVPAFRYVAALLGGRSSRAALAPLWEVGKFPLRAKLLRWLADVAFCVNSGREQFVREWGNRAPDEPFYDFIGIRNMYPEAFSSVASYFDDPDSKVVGAAVVAGVRFLESPELAMHQERLTPLVENVLAKSLNVQHRRLASEALKAWGQGRILSESYGDPLHSEGLRSAQGKWGSADEPPF
ncbi:hypothetical protein ACFZAU_31945 [Streptomyces sp. NPDC008238]